MTKQLKSYFWEVLTDLAFTLYWYSEKLSEQTFKLYQYVASKSYESDEESE